MSEQDLARSCLRKERMAEDELYRRYAVRVHTLCKRYLGDEDDAKDLMVDTLIRALDMMETYEYTGEGSLYGWISKIAVNKALNQIKRHRWRIIPLDLWEQESIPEPTCEEVAEIPKEKLLKWIAELSDLRRAVFNLHCIDGYSHKEIGSMLGISESGSTSILAKARKQLKEKINRYREEQEL